MSNAKPSPAKPSVNLQNLLDEFYVEPVGHRELGKFESRASVPSPYDGLLDHQEHMTVTVEAYAGEPVDVQVHASHMKDHWYSREITLITQQSQRIVQYGIVRLDTTKLDPVVWQQIQSQQTPLGRVLINHNVLREVELCGLWEVSTGPSLGLKMDQPSGTTLYGRTALIYCDRQPAIELLEIVNTSEK